MTIVTHLFSPGQVSLLFCLVLLTGCDRQIDASSNDEDTIMQISNQLTTRCVGRYLIDLPADLILTSRGGQTIDGVRLRVTPATTGEFKKLLAERTISLKAAVASSKGVTYPALRQTLPLPTGLDGVLFDAAEPESVSGRMARILEVIAFRDGYLLQAEVGAVDTTFPEEKENETLHAYVKTDVAQKIGLILDIVSRTRGRKDTDIPTQQGVCIVNGFVQKPPTIGESVGMIFQFRDIDNFYVRAASSSLSRGKNTILDRIERTRPLIESSNGKVFKKAKRNVGGMNGYEVAYSMLTDENAERGRVMVDQFIFELNAAEGSKRTPRMRIEVLNGKTLAGTSETEVDDGTEPEASTAPLKPAPLSTDAVEKMWDKIIPTIRARPNAF